MEDGHIVLVGLSGTGKSTVAPRLAEHLGCDWVDLDRAVEDAAGTTVAEVFEREGQAGFRARELRALGEALAGPAVVVATGGGVVTTPEARAALEEATVVWLRAEPEVLAARLAGTAEVRPLLGDDAQEALARLAAERDPLYRTVADLALRVGSLTPEQVADALAATIAGSPR